MAASITITRPLTQHGCNLVSAFNINTIDFTADVTGLADGWYLTVDMDGYIFTPYIESVSGVNNYCTFDFSDILKNIVSEFDFNHSESKTYTIKLYNVSDVIQASQSESIIICFGYNQIGQSNVLIDLYNKGRSYDFYTCEKYISFFWKGIGGSYNFKINGGTSFSKTVVNGFNYINVTQIVSGYNILTCDTVSEFDVRFYYREKSGNESLIYFSDKDGTLNNYAFELINKELTTSKSNEISNYFKDQSNAKYLSRNITISSNEKLNFRTLSYDTTHLNHLVLMDESYMIRYEGLFYSISDSTKIHGSCKQNKRFNISLISGRYAASY